MSAGRPVLIGLAGPSASGKSTLARWAQAELNYLEVVKLDAFFREAVEFPMVGGWRNWELPENIRCDELCQCLSELRAGREAEVPIYSKPEGRRTGSRVAQPAPIVLVEGFLLYAEPRVRDLLDCRVYLETSVVAQRRRREERDPAGFDGEYFDQVVAPGWRRYGAAGRDYAQVVLDGDRELEAVGRDFRVVLEQAYNGVWIRLDE